MTTVDKATIREGGYGMGRSTGKQMGLEVDASLRTVAQLQT